VSTVPSQDYAATITWTQDWSAHLTLNGGLTIASATAVCTDARVTIAQVTAAATTVTFRLSQAGITTSTVVAVDVTVTLSNGDTDQRRFAIQFTDT
jgi:hypothetical protein